MTAVAEEPPAVFVASTPAATPADFTPSTLPGPWERRPLTPVDCWGGRLYVRRMSAGEAQNLPDDTEAFMAALVIGSTVYADGTPVWTTEEQAMAYPMRDLRPLITAALLVNGFGKDVQEEKKEP